MCHLFLYICARSETAGSVLSCSTCGVTIQFKGCTVNQREISPCFHCKLKCSTSEHIFFVLTSCKHCVNFSLTLLAKVIAHIVNTIILLLVELFSSSDSVKNGLQESVLQKRNTSVYNPLSLFSACL